MKTEDFSKMSRESLLDLVAKANQSYRAGEAELTDKEYEAALEKCKEFLSEKEFTALLSSLHEEPGKVKHEYVMGSLKKIKSDDAKGLADFLKNHVKGVLNVSAKVDGISCCVKYDEKGHLKQASTRGDGYFGIDVTDKIRHVQAVPESIYVLPGNRGCTYVRGELVIFKKAFESFNGEFSNPRNAAAGIINRKEASPELVRKITFVPYEVMGGKLPKAEQFKFLEENGFSPAEHVSADPGKPVSEMLDWLTDFAQTDWPYQTDGLVLSDENYKAELGSYYPEGQTAFKTNLLTAESRVCDIDWGEPSKEGKLTPVAVIDPVEIGGSVISRASLYNADFIKKMGIMYGSKVIICKSGDVIPKIIKLAAPNGSECKEVIFPSQCPSCFHSLVMDGIDLFCRNENCPSKKFERMTNFIKFAGVKNVSKATLEKLGIGNIRDLLAFRPDEKSKIQAKFYSEILKNVLSKSLPELVRIMNFKGLAQTSLDKLIEAFPIEQTVESFKTEGFLFHMAQNLPKGIGMKMLESYVGSLKENYEQAEIIIEDPRHCSKAIGSAEPTESKGSICVTGTLSVPRSVFLEKVKKAGWEPKSSVSRSTSYLVTNDPSTGSSKNVAALKYNVKVISEEDFLKMIDPSAADLKTL